MEPAGASDLAQVRPQGEDAEGGEDGVRLPDSRSGARRLALQALYWESSCPGQLEEALGQLAMAAGLRPEHVDFAGRLARAAVEHAGQLDRLIADAATNWRPERIARLDGLVLRLALAELLFFDDIPARVSICEAVELAKAYGGGQSYAFVNGVLDAIARGRGLAV